MSSDIIKELFIQASPNDVYGVLVDSDSHTKLTGGPAEIENNEGGSFSTFGGAITGTFEKLVPGEKIVQKWRAGAFPEGFYTKAIFEFSEQENGTLLKFRHTGVPPDAIPMIEEGWETNYWSNFETFFD